MNAPGDETQRRMDTKIDSLVEMINALSTQVDTAVERLTREDSARVRRAFQAKEKEEKE